MRRFLFLTLFSITTIFFSACDQEDNNNPLPTQPQPEPETFAVQWDNLIDLSTENDTDVFIGTQYIGVQNRPLMANPPYIYVGATFPKKTFAASFEEEVLENKHSIDLSFNFQSPADYITSMETVKMIEYKKKLKEALKSEEYKSYTLPTGPYIAKIANVKSLADLENYFPENKSFGNTMEMIGKQHLELKNTKSISIGKIIVKGFTVSMDVPTAGLFIDAPSNLSELVYVRTLTYGVTAYFIIASEHSYQEVLKAFKFNGYQNLKHKSQIILLTVSDQAQEAIMKSSFDDLTEFLKNPFSEYRYGYPIFCNGCYVENNSAFKRDN